MNHKMLAISCFIVLFLFTTACSPAAKETTVISPPKEVRPTTVAPQPVEVKKLSPEIQTLVNKGNAISSYKYTFDSGLPGAGYMIYARDNKVRKVYSDTVKLDQDIYYNEVFLDLTARTAVATCTKAASISCQSHNDEAFTVSFLTQRPAFFPLELLDRVTADAHIAAKERFDNRDVTIIEFTNVDGRREQLSLDNYYGLPLRQVIYENEVDIKEKHTFTQISVGNILNSEVTLPEGYTLVK